MTTVLHSPAQVDAPIACDMSGAPDTPTERLTAYRRLFERALASRERRDDGVVLTFRLDARDKVEELARREAACCPFLDYRVEVDRDAVVWTTTDPLRRADAAAVLDAFFTLPDPR